jgi:superfamily II DNA or RNA helicase/diadenosine tetraphosphate (Ap4A) HIT family hydrolase
MTSPFLAIPPERWLCANGVAFAFRDNHPVSPGHALVVARRVVPTWFEATREEQLGILDLVEQVKAMLEVQDPRPDGYNVGFNAGEVAGQTVMHLHMHVIPRFRGDMPDPRGGVRHVIPWKGNYKVETLSNLSQGGLGDPFLEHVAPLWRRAARVSVLAAFVRQSGLGTIRHLLEEACQSPGFRFRIVAGDYLGITQPEALEQLRGWEALFGDQVEVRVVETALLPGPSRSFHPKSWIFESVDGDSAFVGSSNVSRSALTSGIEWNLRLEHRLDPTGWGQVKEGFETWWSRGLRLTTDWLTDYRARVERETSVAPEVLADPPERLPEPHRLQIEALVALEQSRLDGHGRALVVMATGLGKTLVAALDAVALARDLGRMPRILVLAHREELLEQAALTFQRAFVECGYHPHTSWFAGSQDGLEGDLVFAMVQKLSRREHLERLQAVPFDYVFVDEAHHSEADSYRSILDRLEPRFLLGVTATPERADGADLLGLFDDHVSYQAGLGLGIEEGLLAPFAYIGLKDEIDYRNIPWRNLRFDPGELAKAAATQRRMEKLWEGWVDHPGTRTLVFCCSVEHADFASAWLRAKGVRSEAIHSGPRSANRTKALLDFRAGILDAICTVDLFNEGVDLPAVDRVVMLRPTESPVIFLQQLGRGLRRHAGKVQLKVLDFVGNHRVFLDRMRVLLAAADASFVSVGCWLAGGASQLPAGCLIEVEWEAKDLLQAMLPHRKGALGAVGAELLEQIFDEDIRAQAS